MRDSATLYVGDPEEQTRLKTKPAYLLEHLKHLFLSEQFEALNDSVKVKDAGHWYEQNLMTEFSSVIRDAHEQRCTASGCLGLVFALWAVGITRARPGQGRPTIFQSKSRANDLSCFHVPMKL